jgi:hypothetical protein
LLHPIASHSFPLAPDNPWNHRSVTFFTVSQAHCKSFNPRFIMLPPQLGEPASFVHVESIILVSYLVRLCESPQTPFVCLPDLPHADAMHSLKMSR